ncbi:MULTISPECIES: beta-lactamase hydrolase domain-containing protein [unclassified Acinetobacter]|uniref:beta-lactamase hydrolase domain-containing protein n=1 Tax=unclassified Acinetobacter TaxID=196816 RepID=UPI0013307BAE|nr:MULTISPECIES: sulfur transferase domain-containing protein [unclassified Acinetobacter]
MTKLFWKGVVLVTCFSCITPVFAAQELSRALTSTVSVTGQMTTNKFQQLMQQGFKSVIVNRPDQEQGNQVKVGQLRSIAEKSQVSVIYQPIMSGQISQANIEEFARSYNELPKPILMVCRSGTRSATLFNQAKSQGLIHE